MIGLSVLQAPSPAFCLDNDSAALRANTALRVEMKTRFERLQKEQLAEFSEHREKKLKDLERMIGSLEQDAARMESLERKRIKANVFLRELIKKRISVIRDETNAPPTGQNYLIALHERALQLVSEDRLSEAAGLYEEIVLRDPEDDEAYLIMGHVYLMGGQYEKAESAFLNACHIDPENRSEITPFYEDRLLRNPEDDDAYADLGFAWVIVGDPTRAKQAFRDSLAINASNETALKGLKVLEKHGL